HARKSSFLFLPFIPYLGPIETGSTSPYTSTLRKTMCSVLALILLVQASGAPLIRVDSRNQGRTFFVDTSRTEIRRELRDVTAPSPAGPLPSWLPPFPDA